jgi:hypothetical protein
MQAQFYLTFKERTRVFYWLALILAWAAMLGAGSLKMGADEIQVTGRVYVMGNEPFTVVAIELDDGKVYALVGDQEKKLRTLQGKRVTVRGRLSKERPRGAEAIDVTSYELAGKK